MDNANYESEPGVAGKNAGAEITHPEAEGAPLDLINSVRNRHQRKPRRSSHTSP